MNTVIAKIFIVWMVLGLLGQAILFSGWHSGHNGYPWWRGQLALGTGFVVTTAGLAFGRWLMKRRLIRQLRQEQQQFREAHYAQLQAEAQADDNNH